MVRKTAAKKSKLPGPPRKVDYRLRAVPKAPVGAVKLSKEIRKSVDTIGAKAAAQKYGASVSYVRRIASHSANRKTLGKVFRTRRGLNFLNKRIEESDQEKVIVVDGVSVVPKGLADHIVGQHGEAARAKHFLTQAEAIDHAKTIVGASAALFVYETPDEDMPWTYGVLDDPDEKTFDKLADDYFGEERASEEGEG